MTLKRRDVHRSLFGAMLAAPLAAQSTRGALYAYMGCYTTAQRNARGDGIHVYRIDRRPAHGHKCSAWVTWSIRHSW